ncbi:pyridoxal-phosphate dependent enzyme [Streptomyces sp. GZWMJZ-114]|uniref:1-aminocyclopropane-1-carboxylate deaminase/D-cysteine desulfhydrase n=1 Tax=Streptomyces sp. GZWMJZ-114 TaxID=2494734 RepID=UPI001F5054CB|nr:pyridoxal-phosphate dependent enzyme [Streptomyces sp. GZWMJZ-114]
MPSTVFTGASQPEVPNSLVERLGSPALPSPLREVVDAPFARRGVRLFLKRDDLVHPEIPGNKWRKLVPALAGLVPGQTLVTFGGAWSSHLRATAAAGRLLGVPTVGLVRGDELASRPFNAALERCRADGMRLHFVDRSRYRRKREPETLRSLLGEAGVTRPYVVPEGGSSPAAVRGCAELGRELRGQADVVAVACGTGGTLAGIAAGLGPGSRALGIPVVKGGFLADEVRSLQSTAFGSAQGTWSLDERFHAGGYGRLPDALDRFALDFEDRHGLAVERLYVAKLLHALTCLAEEGAFSPGTRVAAVITGVPGPGLSSGLGSSGLRRG